MKNYLTNLIQFQSTLPREERLLNAFYNAEQKISIHAPTRGATAIDTSSFVSVGISIHAPTRGATRVTCKDVFLADISIHAPTRGATAILHKKFVYFYTIPTINI